MNIITKYKDTVYKIKNDKQFANDRSRWISKAKSLVVTLFRFAVIIGICYVIIGPLIGMLSSSFFSDEDQYNPMVYLIPSNPTLERYRLAFLRLDYIKVLINTLVYDIGLMIIQVLVCSMVGYGFARFQFPFKKFLFSLVIIMIIMPTHTIMLPLYLTFQQFDIFGIIKAVNGEAVNLLKSSKPMIIMTLFGCGLRSGLYIYIFNQFFRGLPKEIEEAAFVDGAGMWTTYFRIMLVNAIPSVITVAIFSLVWQYNDTFFSRLFVIDANQLLSRKIVSLQDTIANADRILDISIQTLYVNAGIILVILPVILIYIVLQKKFIEGVERSGIVG